jgi:Spy/CpxP family protein refolding chaperone
MGHFLFSRKVGCFLVSWAALSAVAWAQPAPKPTPGGGVPAGRGGWVGQGAAPAFTLPGYVMLGTESTQKELKVTDEQKQQLKALAEKYQADMRQQYEKVREVPKDEQAKFWADWRQKSAQRQAEIRKEVEAVLQPEQVAKLKELNLRMRGPGLLSYTRTMEQLDLTAEQKTKLQGVRDEWQQKQQKMQQEMQKLQQEMFDKSFQLLTPAQQDKLKEQVNAQTW